MKSVLKGISVTVMLCETNTEEIILTGPCCCSHLGHLMSVSKILRYMNLVTPYNLHPVALLIFSTPMVIKLYLISYITGDL